MKLIFSTSFDTGYYLDYSLPENKNLFNVKICGPKGLLEVLERITGNSGNYPVNMERRLAYVEILDAYFSHNKSIFNNSFNIDRFGVAGELLRFRDQLILAGWNKNAPDISTRIDTLREIEKSGQPPPGNEDRYRKLLEHLGKRNRLDDIEEITVHDDPELIHPFYKILLETLGKITKISYPGIETSNRQETILDTLKRGIESGQQSISLGNEKDKSLEILRFSNDIEAAMFFAQQEIAGPGTVLIHDNPSIFENVTGSFGLPSCGVTAQDANSLLLQLFKLSASLYTEPLNIHHYMAYLQSPMHPVTASLRHSFLREISDNGGIDREAFVEMIDTFHFDDDPEKETKKKEDAKTFLLPMGGKDNDLVVQDLNRFYNGLANWAVKMVFSTGSLEDKIRTQLRHLATLCQLQVRALHATGKKEIGREEFLQHVYDIYESCDFQRVKPQLGAPGMIREPGQLIDNPTHTIWLGFYNNEIAVKWYDYLNEKEIAAIDPGGNAIWRHDTQSAYYLEKCLRAARMTEERLTLVITEKSLDTTCTDHPFFAFLKARVSDLQDLVIRASSIIGDDIENWSGTRPVDTSIIKLPENKQVHEIENGRLIRPRETESYSSTELLIQSPFDWVFQYPMHIKPGFTYQLPDVETTMGNVAHNYINTLFTLQEYDLDAIKERLSDHYREDIATALEKYGAILLLPENAFDRSRLISQLRDSVEVLLDLINDNSYGISGTEVSYTASLPGQGGLLYTGNIDLVLKDRNDIPVIFDLKWSRKPQRYSSKVREQKAIQLELYREILEAAEKKEPKVLAYFILSHGYLITSDETLTGQHINRVRLSDNPADVGARIHNSMTLRKRQFAKGHIEEAEEAPLNEIEYVAEEGYEDRIPIEQESAKKASKKVNYYSAYRLFKGHYR